VRIIRAHKVYSYLIGVQPTMALASYAISAGIGTSMNMHGSSDWATSLTATGIAVGARTIISLTLEPVLVWFVAGNYDNKGEKKYKEFVKRYAGYAVASNLVDFVVGTGSQFLFFNLPYTLNIIPNVNNKVFYGRIPGGLITYPTNTVIYDQLILKRKDPVKWFGDKIINAIDKIGPYKSPV